MGILNPDGTAFVTSIAIPDGSSAPTAAAFNPALEAIANNAQYLFDRLDNARCVPVLIDFIGNNSFTLPADAAPFGIYDGCGGGGAGGAGGISSLPGLANSGGGGGGGAVRKMGVCPLVPGETYSVVVGAGGVPGAFGLGEAGGDTTLTRDSTSDVIVRCPGGGGGMPAGQAGYQMGSVSTSSPFANTYAFARGGRPVRIAPPGIDPTTEQSPYKSSHFDKTPQAGGLGTCSLATEVISGVEYGGRQATFSVYTDPSRGNASPEGFDPGAGGTPGTHNGTLGGGGVGASLMRLGGGPGGGGGAGPYGNGADGGSGSDGAAAGSASSAPGDGGDAADNTGAGGGGGGGAGGANSSYNTTDGGACGLGGSGRFGLIYFRKMQP